MSFNPFDSQTLLIILPEILLIVLAAIVMGLDHPLVRAGFRFRH